MIHNSKRCSRILRVRYSLVPWETLGNTDSFSIIHALAYSFIGFQTMYIATNWNPIYWNTACLIVNSGSLEDGETEEENDDVEVREKSSDYAKIAKALGDTISKGINVSLVDINKSNYSFEPDVDNNQVLFGMKALSGMNSSTIEEIFKHRPYVSLKDFINRCPLNKTAMISLIKAGAFDNLEKEWAEELNIEPRILAMAYYLYISSDLKNKLNLQNFNSLIQKNLIPASLDFQKRVFNFNKFLKTQKRGDYYLFNSACETFYNQFFDVNLLEVKTGIICILQSTWDKIYKKEMDAAREWLKNNQEQVLKEFNSIIFLEAWNKYAQGSISAWEMESLCFYYHSHELINVNTKKYGIVDFNSLSEESEVDYFFKRNGRDIPIYKTYKIIGTVIAKNDNKSSIDLLTTSGVVTVKFTKEYFAMFNRQISEIQEDGTKKIKEKGWFTRGTKLMVTGYRREDTFVGKTYKNTPTHQLYKIISVLNNGDMELTHERYGS